MKKFFYLISIRSLFFSCFFSFFLIFALFSLLSLSGCSGMSGQFDCNVSSGGSCVPMDQVNQMADQGFFSQTNDGTDQTGKTNAEVATGELKADQEAYGYPLKSYAGQPIRYGETVQQIWIAPYVDTNNNYHEPSYVYTVVKKGHWIGEPVKAIQN